MAEIADAFNQWLRDYVTEGVPTSGINPPSKAEGRAIGPIIEAYIDAKVIDLVNAILGTGDSPPSGPYTMPTFVAAGGVARSGLSVAAPYYSGLAAGDIAIIQVRAPTPIRPSGWTQMGSSVSEGGSSDTLYWRRLDGTESGTVTVTASGGSAMMTGWRGCVDNGDPYEALDTDHGTGNPGSSRSITTTGVQRRAVILWTLNTFAGNTSDPDTGWTEAAEDNDGITISFIADTQAMALADTAAAAERTSSGTLFSWASFSFALLPTS